MLQGLSQFGREGHPHKNSTLPETNVVPENSRLGDYVLFGKPIFGCYVSFTEGNITLINKHNNCNTKVTCVYMRPCYRAREEKRYSHEEVF